ncbi:MAG: PTS sugar transporter subunit IIA [Thermoplasmata archaeon]|nr:PTS sugar transporter subunit IIA [Thermoplasmata archaeon]
MTENRINNINSNGAADEVMTLREVAEYLKLNQRSVLKMAHEREIPATKVLNHWRFMRSLINEWLICKMGAVPSSVVPAGSDNDITFADLLRDQFINVDIVPADKVEILGQLIYPLVQAGVVKNRRVFLDRLIQREEMLTTVIGNSVAVPHMRHPSNRLFTEPALAVGICREGTYFGAENGDPTHIFFLICADDESRHLRILAKVGKLAADKKVTTRLRKARTVRDVTDILNGW